MCIVDLRWVNIRALTVTVGGPNLPNRVILLDNAVNLLWLSQSAPEIFAVKLERSLTSRRILDVFCLPKF